MAEKGRNPGRTYWMIVTSPENYRRTRDLGFTVQGVKSRHKKKVEKIRPGDRVVYYVTRLQVFAATASVTSSYFEDHSPVWKTLRPEEDYPHRFRIAADHVLEEPEMMDARQIAPRLEYVRRWPPEYWSLAFQGNVHVLSGADFELLESEIQRLVGRRAAVS